MEEILPIALMALCFQPIASSACSRDSVSSNEFLGLSAVALALFRIGVGFALDWVLLLMLVSVPLVHFGVFLREVRYLKRKFRRPIPALPNDRSLGIGGVSEVCDSMGAVPTL